MHKPEKQRQTMKNILIAMAAAMLVFACREDGIKSWDGRDFIYFGTSGSGNATNWADSVMFNFFFNPVADTTIHVPVFCGGSIADHDREYLVDVEVLGGTAGEDFVIPARPVMPAGSAKTTLPVKLLSTDALEGNKFGVKLTLRANDNFHLDMPEIYERGDTLRRLTFRVEWDNMVSEPPTWRVISSSMGPFTYAKYALLTTRYGITPQGWSTFPPNSSSFKFMTPAMGNPYLVDFSNYLRDQINLGPEAAIKDPDPLSTRGYMTIPGNSSVPKVTIPDDFPTVEGWTGPTKK
jgi:hypothetical protein